MDSTKIFNLKDPSSWPQQVTDHEKQLIVKYDLYTETKLKEIITNLPKDIEGHVFSTYLFHTNALNAHKKLLRDWLIASCETNASFVVCVDNFRLSRR